MTVSLRDRRRPGYPQADIDLAMRQQEAEKRAGGPMRSMAEVLAGKPARARPDAAPSDLTARQLRRRGRYGQAALLADQEALTESDEARATEAREISGRLKKLARQPGQLESDFFVANISMGVQYWDAMIKRMRAAGGSASERRTALATLALIIRYLAWESYVCERSAVELAEILDMDAADMTRTLQLLERAGAISRVKRGRTKIITITPEGAYRGDINRHAEAVDRYRAEVVPLKPAKA